MSKEILEKARNWVESKNLRAVLRQEIQDLINDENIEELTDRFYRDLEFGTGGIRGIVGAGTNRMNSFTIHKVTQGLANYIIRKKIKDPSVVIGFDSRLSSVEFAKESAKILAESGIKTHFFDSTRATPVISFAVRFLKASAGIVITASHNPTNYNGYKVLWSDGRQVTNPNDSSIIAEVDLLQPKDIKSTLAWKDYLKNKSIVMITSDVDEAYYLAVLTLPLSKANPKFKKGIIYTPLHGVGYNMVNHLLEKRGFLNYSIVKSQQWPDGNFPTLKYPNPEEDSSMDEAIKISQSNDYLILANDPDADRLGVMLRKNKVWKKLTGNQIGQLLLYYWLNLLKKHNCLPSNGFVVSSIVTSDLGKKITESFDLKYYETLTGFKNIGLIVENRINLGDKFVFAYEESHGYQFGDYIREKDGISAVLMFSELFRDYDSENRSVFEVMDEIYAKYGYHQDVLVNKEITGKTGALQIGRIMQSFRDKPFKKLAGEEVVKIKDYNKLIQIDCITKKTIPINDLPSSNVLAFYLSSGTRIMVRPSGTEPKIKFYFNFVGKNEAVLTPFIKDCKDEFLARFEHEISTL